MSLRAITLPEDAEAGAFDGPRGNLRWVAVSDLRVDDTYQRPLGRKNWTVIKKIAARFSWAYFQPVMIAPLGDGVFGVIDGQHRVHAALLAGVDHVPAFVVDVPPADQARAFAEINGERTAVSAFHLLKAGLASGEGWAVGMDRAVTEAGCRLMVFNRSFKHRKPREIYALGLVRDHVAAGRSALVTRGLGLLCGAKRSDDADLWNAAVLRPWLEYLRGSAATDAELRSYLAATDLVRLRGTVGEMRRAPEFARLTDRALMVRVLDLTVKKHVTGGRVAA